jgi:dTDP-4-amino-4,6-dideoxygalactose transaminase
MAEEFIVPKEPKLHWKMFLPIFRDNSLLAPKNGRSVHHLFWARNGIYHGLAVLGVKPGENVLVPAYHCTSLVEPILRYGCEVKFYDINTDLSSNFDDIREKIDQKTRAILAIHYFGFPQPIRKFHELCQARGLYLIEDCAHVLNGSTEEGIALGESGDISIFSWRKFFPLYDGGQLIINNSQMKLRIPREKGDFLLSLKIAKNTFERLFEGSTARGRRRVSSIWKLFSTLARRLGSLNSGGKRALNVNSYEVEFDLNCLNLAMSGISKRILKRVDIAKVVERRQRNYQHLRDAVQSTKKVTLPYPTVPQNICPWVFPLLVHGVADIQLILRARGIPATSWGGVIHPSLILEQFPSARFLYDNLLFLPIHQSMEEKDLQAMIRILGEVLQQRLQVDEKSLDGSLSLSAICRR